MLQTDRRETWQHKRLWKRVTNMVWRCSFRQVGKHLVRHN